MSNDDLQLPYISPILYQHLPQWLLQSPQPSHPLNTPSTTTDSETLTPQQMNVDSVNINQALSNTNTTSLPSSQPTPNMNPNTQNTSSSPPNNTTNYMIMNISSAQLNILVPSMQDFECLYSMLYALNDQLTEKISISMIENYRMMITNFGNTWFHPNHSILITLLLSINDLFISQEIDPFIVKRLLYQIFTKYQTLRTRG